MTAFGDLPVLGTVKQCQQLPGGGWKGILDDGTVFVVRNGKIPPDNRIVKAGANGQYEGVLLLRRRRAKSNAARK